MTSPRRFPPRLSASRERAGARLAALVPRGRRLAPIALLALVAGFAVALLARGESASAGERNRDSFLVRLVPAPEDLGTPPVAPEVARAARRLSLEGKVDQLLMLGFEGTGSGEPARLLDRGELGGLVVAEQNYGGKAALRRLIKSTRAKAKRAGRVPPLFFVSQEGGDLSALSNLPPANAPADTASIEDAAKEALASARALRALGIDGVLGPVLDVGAAEGGPLGVRAFSDDVREIVRFARATVPAYVDNGLISAPLHFPGLGDEASSTDDGPAQVGLTIDQIRRRDLLPFRAAVEAGAQAIVVGHGLYGSDDFVTPASASRFVLTDLLRSELGFKGVAITDDLAAGAITVGDSSAGAGVASIVAGADMVRLSGPPQERERLRAALLAAARSGRISRARLDDAVLRVLELKRKAGLLGAAGAAPAARTRGASAKGSGAAARPPGAPKPAGFTTRPAAPRASADAVVAGIDRREGRPPGPGGGFPPIVPEPTIPGLDRREGRPPGPGGVRQRTPKRKRPKTAGRARTYRFSGPSYRIVPGRTTTYTVPIR